MLSPISPSKTLSTLSEIAKNWYDYLVSKGVNFMWETKVVDVEFDNYTVYYKSSLTEKDDVDSKYYDELIFGVGKSFSTLNKLLFCRIVWNIWI